MLHSCACYFGELVRRFPHPRVVPLSLPFLPLPGKRERSLYTQRHTHANTHIHGYVQDSKTERKRKEGSCILVHHSVYIYIIFFCIPKSYVYKTKRVFFKERNSGARGEGRKKRAPNDLSNTLLFTCGSTHTCAPTPIKTPSFFVFAFFSSLFDAGKREKQKKRTRRKERCVPDIEPDSPAQRLCTHSILHRVYVSESVCVRGSLCVLF